MSVVDDVRKGLQDALAPEMSGLKESINGLKEQVQLVRVDMGDMEKRLLASIEQAKTEILLRVQVGEQALKIAALERQLEESKNRTQ